MMSVSKIAKTNPHCMTMLYLWLVTNILLYSSITPANAESLKLPLIGKLSINAYNISGMVKTDQFLALATDEGTQIQILPKTNQGYLAEPSGVIELNQTHHQIKEFDLEAMAWQAPYLYAIGSHSNKRKKLKPGLNNKTNIERITPILAEPDRRVLFRITLDQKLKPTEIVQISLLATIQNQPILAPFLALASKENGIDIEGLAVREHKGKTQLYVGFRGPVLRGNLTPILKLTLAKNDFQIKKSKLRLVNLGGLGIRDMQTTEKGFLLLGGPVNQTPNRFQLFDWQGKTEFSPLKPKLTLPTSNKGNPEAIVEQNLPGRGNGVWIARDGAQNGDIHFYPFHP